MPAWIENMKLSKIFPGKSLREKYKQEIKIVHRDRLKLGEIVKIKPACIAEIGGGAWDKYVQYNPKCDPQALAKYFQRNDPKIYLAMERHTGLKVLKEISYSVAEVVDEALEDCCAAELLLAVSYPGVLRISDVKFCNLYQEIPEAQRKYRFQYYKGLRLFPELMKNCEEYCIEHGIKEITLSAAYIDLVPFFEEHGFAVEDTPAGRASLEFKVGIPMVKVLA